jgi:anti-sigma factor ChrR (cupin superfamily)
MKEETDQHITDFVEAWGKLPVSFDLGNVGRKADFISYESFHSLPVGQEVSMYDGLFKLKVLEKSPNRVVLSGVASVGAATGLHFHDCIEMIFVREGEMSFEIGGKVMKVTEYARFPQYAKHKMLQQGNKPCRYIVYLYKPTNPSQIEDYQGS